MTAATIELQKSAYPLIHGQGYLVDSEGCIQGDLLSVNSLGIFLDIQENNKAWFIPWNNIKYMELDSNTNMKDFLC